MIASLNGVVKELFEQSLILEVSGVGYEIFMSPAQLSELKAEQQLLVFTYQHVREDANDLYGFSDLESKRLFVNLISVSGVGPKMALNIMATASSANLRDAIASGQSEILQSVSGVGKKTAERVVVELKNKVVGDAMNLKDTQSKDTAIEALRQLGYSNHQAKEAVGRLPADIKSDEERIRLALREVSK